MSQLNGLGRRISEDSRDRAFAMAKVVAVMAEPRPQVRSWRIPGRSVDQGNTSTCVGHAWRNFLRCAPLQSERGPSPWDIYRRAVLLDPWTDNDHEAKLPDGHTDLWSGTSVRAGAKVLQELKHISTYVWAWDVDTLVDWLLTQGPIVVGTNWYSSMDTPNNRGVATIEKKSTVVGGHAYLVRGANVNTELLLCENSWGENWGSNGRFYLSFSDMERLLREDGEACATTETWIKP